MAHCRKLVSPLVRTVTATQSFRFLFAAAAGLGAAFASGQQPPEARAQRPAPASHAPATYADALAAWKSPEDIARFADARFSYDRVRALALAEPADGRTTRPPIHAPEALYANPTGVCVDLARFGVETLNRIDPGFAARYVMLEFEPVVIEGRTLRRHWMASFKRDGKLWFFADSRRPGHVAGPYDSAQAFIADYARYRGQAIVAWREADGFARRTRTVAGVRAGSPAPAP